MSWVASTAYVAAAEACNPTTRLLRHVCHHSRMLELLVLIVPILHRDTASQRCRIRRLTRAVHCVKVAM